MSEGLLRGKRILSWSNGHVSRPVEELTREELITAIYELYGDTEVALAQAAHYKRSAMDMLHAQRHTTESKSFK